MICAFDLVNVGLSFNYSELIICYFRCYSDKFFIYLYVDNSFNLQVTKWAESTHGAEMSLIHITILN